MTQDTFIKIIRSAVKSKGVHISGSQESKLTALARRYSDGGVDSTEAIGTLKSIFSDTAGLGRHEYAEMEKQLKRY